MSEQINDELLEQIQSLFGMRIQHKRDISTNWENSTTPLLSGEFGIETDTGKFKIGDGEKLWNDLPYAAVAPTDIQTLMTFRGAVDSYYGENGRNLTLQFAYGIFQELYEIPNVTLDLAQITRLLQAYNNISDEDWREVANEILPDECIGSVINVRDEGVNYVWVGINNDYDPEDEDDATDSRIDGWEKLGSLFTIQDEIKKYVKNTTAEEKGLSKNPVSESAVYDFLNEYLKDKTMIQEIDEISTELTNGIYQLTTSFEVTYKESSSIELNKPLLLIFNTESEENSQYILIGSSSTDEEASKIYMCYISNEEIVKENHMWTVVNFNQIVQDTTDLKAFDGIFQMVDQSAVKQIYDKVINSEDNITTLQDIASTATIPAISGSEVESKKDLGIYRISDNNFIINGEFQVVANSMLFIQQYSSTAQKIIIGELKPNGQNIFFAISYLSSSSYSNWSILPLSKVVEKVEDLSIDATLDCLVDQRVVASIYNELKAYHPKGSSPDNPIIVSEESDSTLQDLLDAQKTPGDWYYKVTKDEWDAFVASNRIFSSWPLTVPDNYPTTKILRITVEDFLYGGAIGILYTHYQKFPQGSYNYNRSYILYQDGSAVDAWSDWEKN